jgi:hypothetical protein
MKVAIKKPFKDPLKMLSTNWRTYKEENTETSHFIALSWWNRIKINIFTDPSFIPFQDEMKLCNVQTVNKKHPEPHF